MPEQIKTVNPDSQEVLSEEKALENVKTRYDSSWKTSTLDFERFARYYNLFRGKQTKKNYHGLADLFIPEPYRVVRKITAKLSNAIRRVVVGGEGPADKEASQIGTILMSFLRRKLGIKILERTAIQEAAIVGLSWIKATWNLDKEEEDKPWRGFDFSFLTADQVLIDPGSTMLDVFMGNHRWAILEYEASLSELEANKNYKNLDILKAQAGSNAARSALSQARLSGQQTASSTNKKSDKFAIIEYWGKYRTDETSKEENYLIVIANKKIVLRFEKNPYQEVLDNPIPLVPFVGNVVGREFYPIGEIEINESLFNELNDTRNQRMDTVTFNIDPMKEVLRAAKVDEKELIVRRGGYFKSSVANGVRFIPPDMQGVRAAIDEEKFIRGDIQQSTGVLDFSPGSEVQAGISIDTARGTIVAKGESDELNEDRLELLKFSLRMLYRIVLAYSQAFLDREFTISVTEKGVEKFYQVSKASIQGNLDLDIEMKTLQDKTTEQQLKLLMFERAKTVPGAKMGKFFTDLLEAFYDNVNIEEYYQEPAPVEQKPGVSISLRGELSPAEVDEIYKLTGADPKAADPLFRQEFREALRGNLPEHQAIAGGLPPGVTTASAGVQQNA